MLRLCARATACTGFSRQILDRKTPAFHPFGQRAPVLATASNSIALGSITGRSVRRGGSTICSRLIGQCPVGTARLHISHCASAQGHPLWFLLVDPAQTAQPAEKEKARRVRSYRVAKDVGWRSRAAQRQVEYSLLLL